MEKTELELTIEKFRQFTTKKRYRTIYADPPWQFQNRTGKVAPEHKRLTRYGTMKLDEIKQLPVSEVADEKCHLYLWVPNALLPEGLEVMEAWGFEYKTNLIWEKVRKDGMPDGRGVGFYFRNVTEILLFGIKGDKNRIAELLFNDMFYRIKKYYNDSIPDPDGCKKKALEEQISSLKKEYKKKYIKYGIEFPEAIDKIEKQEDIENL